MQGSHPLSADPNPLREKTTTGEGPMKFNVYGVPALPPRHPVPAFPLTANPPFSSFPLIRFPPAIPFLFLATS